MKKPKKVLTVIRTGAGDLGTTWFRTDRQYPKNQLQIAYLGMLDLVQSHAISQFVVQDLIFALGANFYNPDDEKYIIQINQLNKYFETSIKEETRWLGSLSGFIRTTESNASLMQLRAVIRQTEQLACQLLDVEPCIGLHIKSLNILSDYVFVLAWRETRYSEDCCVYTWEGELSDASIINANRKFASIGD